MTQQFVISVFDMCDLKSSTVKNSSSAETLQIGRNSVNSEDMAKTESQVLEYSDQSYITS